MYFFHAKIEQGSGLKRSADRIASSGGIGSDALKRSTERGDDYSDSTDELVCVCVCVCVCACVCVCVCVFWSILDNIY